MITLYQLHWSHYVEKVRWALDFKGVEWQAVDVDPFSKREMRHLECQATLVPTIHDQTTGAMLGESTSIIEYLEQTCPTPRCTRVTATKSNAGCSGSIPHWVSAPDGSPTHSWHWSIRLPAEPLSAKDVCEGNQSQHSGKNHCGRPDAAVSIQVQPRRWCVEQVEQCLLLAAQRLSSRHYLVGESFTAGGPDVAALMRPVVVVPYFFEHPRLQGAVRWRKKQLLAHHRAEHAGYESALHEVRSAGVALGNVSWLQPGGDTPALAEFLTAGRAQRPTIRGWKALADGTVRVSDIEADVWVGPYGLQLGDSDIRKPDITPALRLHIR